MVWTYETYLKVHKYSFKIESIIYLVRTFLRYDILVIRSPEHRAHRLTEHSIEHRNGDEKWNP